MEAISAVRRAVESADLVPRGATVLVGVSGGVDSIVLLDVLLRLRAAFRWKIVAAHFDHALRAGSSEDARFVRALCRTRGVDCLSRRGRVPGGKGGLAARARKARYAFLLVAAREAGARVIATAHTADDQAETLLLRLLRGTGAVGLAGIPPRRRVAKGVEIVRPLLGLTRADVRAHAARFRLVWREDPSNASPARARNRIRHEVLPLLRTFQPDATRVLARAATQAASSARVLRSVARRSLRRVVVSERKGEIVLSREAWLRNSPEVQAFVARAVLEKLRGGANVSAAHVEALCALVRRGSGRAVLARAVARASVNAVTLTTS